jgi:hypothetical protein
MQAWKASPKSYNFFFHHFHINIDTVFQMTRSMETTKTFRPFQMSLRHFRKISNTVFVSKI